MKMSETQALHNKRSLARLNRATPEIFPAPVLIHARGLRWMPPMPRLAADSYWRAHVIRADRLSRALAALGGTPADGPGAPASAACRTASASRRRPIANV